MPAPLVLDRRTPKNLYMPRKTGFYFFVPFGIFRNFSYNRFCIIQTICTAYMPLVHLQTIAKIFSGFHFSIHLQRNPPVHFPASIHLTHKNRRDKCFRQLLWSTAKNMFPAYCSSPAIFPLWAKADYKSNGYIPDDHSSYLDTTRQKVSLKKFHISDLSNKREHFLHFLKAPVFFQNLARLSAKLSFKVARHLVLQMLF